jgi:hypothetical protein
MQTQTASNAASVVADMLAAQLKYGDVRDGCPPEGGFQVAQATFLCRRQAYPALERYPLPVAGGVAREPQANLDGVGREGWQGSLRRTLTG